MLAVTQTQGCQLQCPEERPALGERDRNRDTGRDRGRETERQRQTERDGNTERQVETETKRDTSNEIGGGHVFRVVMPNEQASLEQL